MGAGPVQFLHFLILGDGYMIFKEEFQNPPVEYRIKPFWFWNGDITKEEISHQIKEMLDRIRYSEKNQDNGWGRVDRINLAPILLDIPTTQMALCVTFDA